MPRKTKLRIVCPYCAGRGGGEITGSAHAPNCGGECLNCPEPAPIFEMCVLCRGTGRLTPHRLIHSGWGNNFEIVKLIEEARRANAETHHS